MEMEPTSKVEEWDAGKQVNLCCLRLQPETFHVAVFYTIPGVLNIRNQYRSVLPLLVKRLRGADGGISP